MLFEDHIFATNYFVPHISIIVRHKPHCVYFMNHKTIKTIYPAAIQYNRNFLS
jgi:hypothetical protein